MILLKVTLFSKIQFVYVLVKGSAKLIQDSSLPLQQSVEATAEECRKLGAKAYPYVVDCSLKEEIYSAAEKVKIL